MLNNLTTAYAAAHNGLNTAALTLAAGPSGDINLNMKEFGADAPHINITFSDDTINLLRVIGVICIVILVFSIILNNVLPSGGGEGGGAFRKILAKVGGVGGVIVTGGMCVFLINPPMIVVVINAVLKIVWGIWGLFVSAFK